LLDSLAAHKVARHMTVSVAPKSGTPANLDRRWLEYYAEASRRRRARGLHRRRHDPQGRSSYASIQRKIALFVCAIGLVGVVVALLVP
jgi:hypothetical protein